MTTAYYQSTKTKTFSNSPSYTTKFDDSFIVHGSFSGKENIDYFTELIYDVTPKRIISIQIEDKVHYIDKRLSHIKDVINDARKLLHLKDDWDDDGAITINALTFNRAIQILVIYAENVLNVHDVAIKSPFISAGRDGSIDLDWKSANSEMLITILNTVDQNLHYYGDNGDNNTVIKGVLNNMKINEDLSHWMRKL